MMFNRGFTLIELIVTMAVMGIISAMAAPAMFNIIAKQQLNSTARELALTLSEARSQAALLHREVTVTLNSSNANTQFNYYWQPKTNNRLTSSTASIIFIADGSVKNATGAVTFVICNSVAKQSKTITVSRMGSQSMGTEGICI
jgi:prepilin-type N-terminal cleavage/methylation domain-containing protein